MVSQINLRLKDFNAFLSNSQNEINNRVFIFGNSGSSMSLMDSAKNGLH